jgi:2'-5' RNA ligase
MSRIAVDVVLLPDEAMTNKATEANAKLSREIVLNKENCLPHISLAMGCIDERDVPVIEKVLTVIAKRYTIGDLKIIGLRTSINARGETVSLFEVEKTKEIQSLHEMVMEKVEPYFSSVATGNMIYGDEEVADTTLEWIKNYREYSSFAKFFPHITIGYGQAQEQQLPINFTAEKLALCHLGNHCTCRKVLISVEL